jgi:hypothetical protein
VADDKKGELTNEVGMEIELRPGKRGQTVSPRLFHGGAHEDEVPREYLEQRGITIVHENGRRRGAIGTAAISDDGDADAGSHTSDAVKPR